MDRIKGLTLVIKRSIGAGKLSPITISVISSCIYSISNDVFVLIWSLSIPVIYVLALVSVTITIFLVTFTSLICINGPVFTIRNVAVVSESFLT